MSYRFVKLDKTIIKSTVWAEDHDIFRLWIYLLAEADKDGFVAGTVPGFAIACRMSIERVEEGLVKFESPDKYSANPANEGRRLERVARGLLLLNYADHRDRRGDDQEWQRERHRKNMASYRDRKRSTVTGHVDQEAVTVTTDVDIDINKYTKPPVVVVPTIARHTSSGAKVDPIEAIYQAYPRKVGKRKALESIARAIDRIMAGERGEKEPMRIVGQRWLYAVVKEYANSPAGNLGTKTPHPATWFNQSRYLDDPAEWQRKEENNRADTKADSNARNIATAREFIQELRQARSDHSRTNNPLPELPATSGLDQGHIGGLPRESGDANALPVSSGVYHSSPGAVTLLPDHRGTPSVGRMPDRRPTF